VLAAVAALAGCSLAWPSSTEPKAYDDCRLLPPLGDTITTAAITAVAIIAAQSKCEAHCELIFDQSASALPIGVIAASVAVAAVYGYTRYGRCRATVAAAAAPPPVPQALPTSVPVP
jgi:hypothetical protein